MSVTVNDKNLGHATAYAYAKSKGYAGTEEEFAELMASYAEVATDARGYAEQAEQSASNAQTSATNASASATTADTKASEASASALSAQQSATSASTSAGNASASANSASASAQTATTKASEAEQSATEASESATSANSAKEDAVTAKEEAQASAEEAKASEEAIDLELAKLDASLITDTATGNPSIFPDGANLPVKSLTAEINPVQDLNGYDYPWVGGAGKNQYNGADIIFNGRPSDSTLNGITLTKNSDGSFTVTGTATAETRLNTQATYQFKAGKSYTISVAGLTNGNIRIEINGSVNGSGLDYTSEFPTSDFAKTYTITADCGFNYFFLDVQNGATVNNTIRIQIEEGQPTAWTPYENICPISGYDEVNVTRTGKNLIDLAGTFTSTQDSSVTLPAGEYYVYIFNNLDVFAYNSFIQYFNGTSYESFSTTPNEYGYVDAEMQYNQKKCKVTLNKTCTVRQKLQINSATSGTIFAVMLTKDGSNYASVPNEIPYSMLSELYEPYQSQTVTVTLNDTTYGGTLNVTTGELVVDRAMVTLDGNTQWTQYAVGKYYSSAVAPNMAGGSAVANMFISNLYKFEGEGGSASSAITTDKRFYGQRGYSRFWIYDSSFDTVEALKSMLADTPMTVVYPLDTPQTIQLTASQLSTILGTNVISADSGAVTVEYYANTKLYINKVVNAQS